MALTLHGTVTDNTVALDRRSAKPLVINGDMAVAQRSTSVTGITTAGFYTVDRIGTNLNGAGTWTQTQSTDTPTGSGFRTSLKMDCTTADASPAAGDYLSMLYKFEGQEVQLLKKGTSSAEGVSIAFWVKSAKTGTHILTLIDNDNNRAISKTYTVSSANTWEKKVVYFAGDTTGVLDNDNALSFYMLFYLVAGSNISSGTLQTSWDTLTTTDLAVGQVNLADSTDNNWYLTGLQMEVGNFDANSIPPFQHESYGDSLIRCQRYLWQEKNDTGSTRYPTIGLAQGTGRGYGAWQINEMRTAPTVSVSDVGEFLPLNGAGAPKPVFTTVTNSLSTKNMVFLDLSGSSGLTSGQACPIGINDGHYVRGDAEL
tara:strand:+ start:53 stop:1162 length:1110 start_codon:yes stop_codon:yes gene_type:complete